MIKTKIDFNRRIHRSRYAILTGLWVNLLFFISSCSLSENRVRYIYTETITESKAEITTTRAFSSTESGGNIESSTTPHATTSIQYTTLALTELYHNDEVISSHAFLYRRFEGSEVLVLNGYGDPLGKVSLGGSDLSLNKFDSFKEPCTLNLIATTGENIVLVSQDLQSNKSEIIFSGNTSKESWETNPHLSFDGKWIAFVIWKGEKYYQGAEFQDISIKHIEGEKTKVITQFGGATDYGGIWSPVESILAYSDFNKNHFQQLFLYYPATDVSQEITNFSDTEVRISPISFSPLGDIILFLKSWDGVEKGSELWQINIRSGVTSKINLPDSVANISQKAFWREDGGLFYINTSDLSGNTVMFWINRFGQIQKYWPSKEKIGLFPYLELPVPITKDLLTIGSFVTTIYFDTAKEIQIRPNIPSPMKYDIVLDNIVINADLSKCFVKDGS